MGSNYNYEDDEEFLAKQQQRKAARLARRQRERRMKITLLVCVLILLAGITFVIIHMITSSSSRKQNEPSIQPSDIFDATLTENTQETEAIVLETDPVSDDDQDTPEDTTEAQADLEAEGNRLIEEARLMAMGYDYDGAIAKLRSIPDYENNSAVSDLITEYETTKSTCVPVDVYTVPHLFYHSLVNDTDAAFNVEVLGQGAVDGMNAWMTTVEEFDKITQQLYDNGYVYVRLRDLVVESKDPNGNVHFSPNEELMLPPGKKAVVLSVDDLSYYHSYKPASFPDHLILDENNKIKCHYVKTDGTEAVGDFDVVPRLNTFLEEHPDGAYKGARGLIALTGYDGVFGYRTDIDYKVKEALTPDQAEWLDEHPDFDYDQEIADATVIADAIKASGWEFASHTWGHLSVTSKTADELRIDNERWINNVQNIVGPVDTIIFAHGNDIGDWEPYSPDNDKYQYFKSAGYNFFCNVDSSVPYWVQINDENVRQGRIDADGYKIYDAVQGNTDIFDGLFNPSEVFDQRRPTPVVANGES